MNLYNDIYEPFNWTRFILLLLLLCVSVFYYSSNMLIVVAAPTDEGKQGCEIQDLC